MSVYNFFRDVFGLRSNDQQQTPNYEFEERRRDGDDFRNPIWQTGEDDDEDGDDFRQPRRGDFGFGNFSVSSDPFEVARYFEAQMNEMLKNFFGFSHDDMTSIFGERTQEHFPNFLPPVEMPKTRENLRDEVLKQESGILPSKSFAAPEEEKVDLDLDGKITSDDWLKLWRDPGTLLEKENRYPHFGIEQSPVLSNSFGRSISVKVIRRADGTVEQQRTVRDTEGNEETTVTRQIGDKSLTVVTKKDKNGRKTETETETETVDPIVTMMEPVPIKPFLGIELDDGRREERNPLQDFPWQKFFGPSPRL